MNQLDSVTSCPDCQGTGKEGAPYRDITPSAEGYRLSEVTDPQVRNELVKQGAVECKRTRFYARPGIDSITIPGPEGVHRHVPRCDHLLGSCEGRDGDHKFIDCDAPQCVALLMRDCVDNPQELAVPSNIGASHSTKLRERKNQGNWSWSLSPSNRPYSADELARIREAEEVDLEKFVRGAEQLRDIIAGRPVGRP